MPRVGRNTAIVFLGLALGVPACGDNYSPAIGQAVEIPLLVSADPDLSFNHSREVAIAASGGRVVVTAVHEHTTSTNSFELGPDPQKRVAINVSLDDGRSFGPAIDPQVGDGTNLGNQTSDPVVRGAADGSFFVSILRPGRNDGVLARSFDGVTWTVLAENVPFGDKEWIAIDDRSGEVYVAASGGYWRYGFDGSLRGAFEMDGFQIADAHVDQVGVTFATIGSGQGDTLVTPYRVIRWDGTGAPVLEAPLDPGSNAAFFTTVTWSHGALSDGSWSVRARRDGERGSITVRTERATEITEMSLTGADANAFFPTAALDSNGRLHAAWYDSAGTSGVLRYAHSHGPAPFTDGFTDPIEIDSDATPGGGWYPAIDFSSGARRLREYIGLAIDGDVVHIAWTHAPTAPSRVYAIAIRSDR